MRDSQARSWSPAARVLSDMTGTVMPGVQTPWSQPPSPTHMSQDIWPFIDVVGAGSMSAADICP
jgi:hypothetical protein